jgi:hypothetical protein
MTRTAKAKMCFSKTRYPCKADAVYACTYRLHRDRRRNKPDFLRIYPCPLCNGWHLTRKR